MLSVNRAAEIYELARVSARLGPAGAWRKASGARCAMPDRSDDVNYESYRRKLAKSGAQSLLIKKGLTENA